MIVAMLFAWMMQVSADQVIHMPCMWNRLVPAIWTMLMRFIVLSADMFRSAIARSIGKNVLVNMPVVRVMQVTIMEVVDVTVMLYGFMPATSLMFVCMVFMCRAVHRKLLKFAS